MKLPEKILYCRKRAGLSQEELARRRSWQAASASRARPCRSGRRVFHIVKDTQPALNDCSKNSKQAKEQFVICSLAFLFRCIHYYLF